MKIRTWIGMGLAALTTLSAAAPAIATHDGTTAPAGCRYIRGMSTPEDHTDDVYICREQTWIHKGTQQLGNLAGQGQSTLPSWNTTPPAGDIQSAGVYLASSEYDIFVAAGDPTARATFQGTFTGTLDTLSFQMYLRDLFNETNGNSLGAEIYLEIDGEIIHDNYTTAAIELPLKTDGDFRRVDVAFTNLYDYMKSLGLDTSPTKQHTIKLGLVGWFFPASETAFFFDAVDVPSGIAFNPEGTLSGYTKIDLAVQ
jgi:hypothetical protein